MQLDWGTMGERYTDYLLTSQVGVNVKVSLCSHCGCLVFDEALHDKSAGLDIEDVGNAAVEAPVNPMDWDEKVYVQLLDRCDCGHRRVDHSGMSDVMCIFCPCPTFVLAEQPA